MNYKTTKIVSYVLVIAFYTIMTGLALTTKSQKAEHVHIELEDSIQTSKMVIGDIHSIITWEPFLADIKDSSHVATQRYAVQSIAGANGKVQTIDEALLLRTDIFAEFMKRFNADSTEIERLKVIDFTHAGGLSLRQGCILSLVNDVDVLTNQTIREFVETVEKENIYIDIEKGTNMAAVATIAYKDTLGQVFPVRLTFRKGEVNDAPVWYMTEAESPYFTCGDDNMPFYLDNTQPEMKFIGLSGFTKRSAKSIAGPDFKPDGRTAFLTLTSTCYIKYHWGEDTSFVAWLGDYTVLIEHVESFVHKRSGFLITRIMKGNELIFENR